MPLNNPLIVIIRVSQGDTLGNAMKRVRVWLDNQKVELRSFTTGGDTKGYTLMLVFRNAQDADRFRQQFAHATERSHESTTEAAATASRTSLS